MPARASTAAAAPDFASILVYVGILAKLVVLLLRLLGKPGLRSGGVGKKGTPGRLVAGDTCTVGVASGVSPL
jgi:hypothetical protein